MLRHPLGTLVILSSLLGGCKLDLGNSGERGDSPKPLPKISIAFPKLSLEQHHFESCEAYQQFVTTKHDQIEKTYVEYSAAQSLEPPVLNSPATESVSNASGPVNTNIQVSGVDELDTLKSNSEFIFYMGTNHLMVHNRVTKELTQTLQMPSPDTQLIVDGNILVTVSMMQNYSGETRIGVYHQDSNSTWVLIKSKIITGYLRATRFVDHRLIVIASQSSPVIPELPDKKEDCHNFYYPTVNDLDESVTVASVIEASGDLGKDQTTVLLGGSDHLYVGQEGFYLIRNQIQWFSWDPAFNPQTNELFQKMSVVRLELKNGMLVPTSAGIVEGVIHNSWALNEFSDDNKLAIAVTHTSYEGNRSNWLAVYDYSNPVFSQIGKSKSFGIGEDIRSVRYIGQRGYVVTFRTTDPLFTIDLSNLSQPEIIDELHVPGFSKYLHPLGEHGLVGVGFDADSFGLTRGFQVSLFEIDAQERITEKTKIIFGGEGSYTPVGDDHHSFFYDEKKNMTAIPYVLKDSNYTLTESGMLIFNTTPAPLALKETKRLSHRDWISADCWQQMRFAHPGWDQKFTDLSLDINRMYVDGNELVTFSPYGLKVYSAADFSSTPTELNYGVLSPKCGP